MSDVNLLMFGCGIFFLAAAGAYVGLREGFLFSEKGQATKSNIDRRLDPHGNVVALPEAEKQRRAAGSVR